MNRERLLERFLRYVSCGSESGHEAAFCRLLEEELRAIGLEPERDEVGARCGSDGWNVFARREGEGEPILFCAHMDTVAPGNGVRPVVAEGIVRASGDTILGADDKAGIAAVMEALESLCESGESVRPVEVLFTVCEEVGLKGAEHADYSRMRSKQAVVLDSHAIGEAINRGPCRTGLHVTVNGKPAHAAVSPELGIHALKCAAQMVHEIPTGKIDELSILNIANFVSTGATNVVAERATFDVEIRSMETPLLREHVERVRAVVARVSAEFGATGEVAEEPGFPALHVDENSALVRDYFRCCREMGVEPFVGSTMGGSDTVYLAEHGMDAINIGCGMEAVHGLEEHIAVADLEQAAQLVLALTRCR